MPSVIDPPPTWVATLRRRIRLPGGGASLSALLGEPGRPPRAVIVALHGAGMSAEYFDGAAHPDQSVITLGAQLGFSVLAFDRPGYGDSTARLPQGATRTEQAAAVVEALRSFAACHPVGAGFFLLGHSYGGQVALAIAANPSGLELLGVDVAGCGQEYATSPEDLLAGNGAAGWWRRHWGSLRCYPPGTFTGSGAAAVPIPPRELMDALEWPTVCGALVAQIEVPVRFTFGELESWWRCDPAAVDELAASCVAAPRVVVDHLPASGHNISLGWTARAYHLRAVSFLEECLAVRHAR
jgi:pimeloyl-ACP methyl ester carboxylesterase